MLWFLYTYSQQLAYTYFGNVPHNFKNIYTPSSCYIFLVAINTTVLSKAWSKIKYVR